MSIRGSCCAPNCKETHETDSYHCLAHSRKFLPRYQEYKSLEQHHAQIIKNAQDPTALQTLSYTELLKGYNRLNDMVQRRAAHRKQAFGPEFWDKGHEHRLRYLGDLKEAYLAQLEVVYAADAKEQMDRSQQIITRQKNRVSKGNSTKKIIPESNSTTESSKSEKPKTSPSRAQLDAMREESDKQLEEEQIWNTQIPALILENLRWRQQELLIFERFRTYYTRIILDHQDELKKHEITLPTDFVLCDIGLHYLVTFTYILCSLLDAKSGREAITKFYSVKHYGLIYQKHGITYSETPWAPQFASISDLIQTMPQMFLMLTENVIFTSERTKGLGIKLSIGDAYIQYYEALKQPVTLISLEMRPDGNIVDSTNLYTFSARYSRDLLKALEHRQIPPRGTRPDL